MSEAAFLNLESRFYEAVQLYGSGLDSDLVHATFIQS